MTHDLLLLALLFLAAARVTRLLTDDTITEPIRNKIADRWGEYSMISEFVGCPWCIGFWVSAAGVTLFYTANGPLDWGPCWFTAPALTFALSQLIGASANVLDALVRHDH